MDLAVELDHVRVQMEGGDRKTDFSLAVTSGECILLVGPGRSGKDLILKLCAGLVVPEEGTVQVLGRNVARLDEEERAVFRQRLGIVLAQPGLRSNMTLYANVCLPLVYHEGCDEQELVPRVMPLLEALGVADLARRFPAQLTWGEARCGALARALVREPDLLLLDDIVGGLDAEMVQRVARVLADYRRARGATILATLHSPSPLLAQAERVAFIRHGRIEAVGSLGELVGLSDPILQLYLGIGTNPISATGMCCDG
jgi:ABC-type transporter Mla maintaining outer membrane lipid asymmetry ATPase subunit MlaF